MNLHRYFLLSVTAVTLAACGSDSTSPKFVTPPPAGLVRFINAVPDTGFQDFRFMDVVEGVPNVEFVNLPFRGGTNVAFQRTAVGTHHIRVFMGSSNTTTAAPNGFDPSVVSTVMADTTFTFTQDVAQTFVFYGPARSGAQKFLITTDDRPALTATSGTFGYRATNVTGGAVDIYLVPGATAATAASGTPVITNLAPLGTSTYITPAVAGAASNYTVVATTAGTTTVVATQLMPVGSAFVPEVSGSSGALDPVAGSRISGSIFTSYIFPGAVVGSKAAALPPAAPNTTPALALAIDKNPPRP